jgi:hypothetical protein
VIRTGKKKRSIYFLEIKNPGFITNAEEAWDLAAKNSMKQPGIETARRP